MRSIKFRIALFVIISLYFQTFFCSPHGVAETINLETVRVTAGRVEKELLDVPQAVTVITQDDIKKSSARTVGEMLQDVPGVTILNSGAQGIKHVQIRAEGSNRTLILIDGQKVSENKAMDGPALLVDPATIDRIEVIKGPASVLYGSEAIGGVVNIITKKGGEKPIGGIVSGGFHGTTGGFSESLSLGGTYKGFSYRITGSYTDQPNYHSPEKEVKHTRFLQRPVAVFLSYDVNDHVTIGGNYENFYSKINAGTPDNPGFFVHIDPWKRQKGAVFVEATDLTKYLPRMRFDAFYQGSNKNMLNHVPISRTVNMGILGLVDLKINVDNYADNDNNQYGGSAQVDWALGNSHYLITGYEGNKDILKATTDQYSTVSSTLPFLKKKTFKHIDYEGEMLTHALFAQLESQLPHDFVLTLGARQTWVRSEMDKAEGYTKDLLTGTSAYLKGGKTGSRVDSSPVFNAGIMWTGIGNLSIRTNFSQGFRVPSLNERYVTSVMGGSTILPSPDLKPEYSNSWDAGLRYADYGLIVDATVFYSEARDYLGLKTVDKATNTTRRANIGKAKTHGAELAISYDLAYGFTPYANLTYMRRQYDYGDFKTWKSGTPTFLGRAGLRFTRSVSQEVEFLADAYTRFATESKSEGENHDIVKYDQWITSNFSLGLRFGDKKQYSVIGELLNIGNYIYKEGGIVAPGRSANIKVCAEF